MRGDEMKHEKYLTLLFVMCMLSYFMMVNLSYTAAAEDIINHNPKGIYVVKKEGLVYDLRDNFIREKELISYIQELTGLEYDDCEFIINECNRKNMDPFIILGLIKRESNFNPSAEGKAGERGLGQLMENTARAVAENLGYIYDKDKLFDPRYNLKLTITQLSYLLRLYNNDTHMALTAYNRGQQGLADYMEKSDNLNTAASDYSDKIMQYAKEYKNGFSFEALLLAEK